jgi:hypothetical protein
MRSSEGEGAAGLPGVVVQLGCLGLKIGDGLDCLGLKVGEFT